LLRKYCPTDRFFAEGLIRFTQPSGLNDPDDARPDIVIGKYTPEDYASAREQAKQAGFDPITDADLEAIFLRPFPNAR
jgi:hypothetical protein